MDEKGNSMLDHYMEIADRDSVIKAIEKVLLTTYEEDDSHVVDLIVGLIRSGTGIEDFAKGACFADHKPEPSRCPHCIKEHRDTARVIYGYTDDSDDELNDRHGKDLYLAGCVPDGYGINIARTDGGEPEMWVYPSRYCNICKKYFDYVDMDTALRESP